ncbi:MAG: hypothetical protein IPN47_16140 [Gemmatimonadetes bacterium]|nr:hypothetical protein [Gemmatimonadota bacterium]
MADPPANLGIVTQVDARHAHACAVKADGGVACWGYNALGRDDDASQPPGGGSVVFSRR